MGKWCTAARVRLIVSPNGEGLLAASRLVRVMKEGTAHGLTTPLVCRIEMLTSGGRKNVVTEEAVPGGGERASQGQSKSKRRGLVKREEDGCDTVLAVGKTEEREERDKQPNVLECGSMG